MSSRAEQIWQRIIRALVGASAESSMRLAILAAHPDDETIGASTLMSRFPNTEVIFVTDGAPRDRGLWAPGFQGSRHEYASLRHAEAKRASALAGIPAERIHWLSAVDQEAVFSANQMSRALATLVADIGVDVVVTHSYEGGHPDHDAAALIARLAITQLRAEETPVLIEMTSYHARDCQCVTGEFLNAEAESVLRVELSGAERLRKQQMFAAYRSQRLVLSAFSTERECFRLAPAYDFSRPPYEGKLWYECMGWPVTGERWRELAAHAIADVQEYACR